MLAFRLLHQALANGLLWAAFGTAAGIHRGSGWSQAERRSNPGDAVTYCRGPPPGQGSDPSSGKKKEVPPPSGRCKG